MELYIQSSMDEHLQLLLGKKQELEKKLVETCIFGGNSIPDIRREITCIISCIKASCKRHDTIFLTDEYGKCKICNELVSKN